MGALLVTLLVAGSPTPPPGPIEAPVGGYVRHIGLEPDSLSVCFLADTIILTTVAPRDVSLLLDCMVVRPRPAASIARPINNPNWSNLR